MLVEEHSRFAWRHQLQIVDCKLHIPIYNVQYAIYNLQSAICNGYCTRELQMRKIVFMFGCLAVALAGCGQSSPAAAPTGSAPPPTAAPPTSAPTVASQPTAAPAPTALASAPTASPQPGAGDGTSIAPPPELVSAAQLQLALHLKVSPANLALQSANAQEWPDGGLGCPAEGMAYPQVVTPGFLLIFTDAAQSARYEVHAGRSAAQMVLCENGKPVDLAIPSAAAPPAAGVPADQAGARIGELARTTLVREQGLAEADVAIVAVEPAEWRDSSLGCPQPGMNYLQVITPGYKITLEAQGKRYEYHSDTNERVVRCDQP